MTKTTYGTMYYVDSMSQAVSFYKSVLGTAPAHESEDWTEFDFAGHRLCLHAKRKGETYPQNGILIFEHDGIKSHFEKMKADGLQVFGLHEVHPGASTFHLKDAFGNEVSFYGKP